ncbi:MAG: PBP1A family penicillin-binding protein [Firmicutes bacterium]|nr:PBP1A family penicillin-binding protein [Bacillota bacterium]
MVNKTGNPAGNNPQAPQKKKKKRKIRVFSSILLTLVMICMIGVLAVAGWVIGLTKELPEITAEDLMSAQTSFIYDQDGVEVTALHGAENRISVDLDQMPSYLVDAVLASEDERFYVHRGVDFRSMMRAAVVDLRDTLTKGELTFSQGASTITMQLVRNVVDDTEKTMTRKVKEALLALELEKHYPKDEILYYYLNEIYIGPNTYGMQAAAQYYFGKDVSEVSLSEACLLAGILRNPGYYSPYSNPEGALALRNTVLNNLIRYDEQKYGVIAEEAKSDELIVVETNTSSATYDYPWYIDHVISEASDVLTELGYPSGSVYTGGLRIYTGLNRSVQEAMESSYANADNFPASNSADLVESGMVILDPSNGCMRGIVGGREYKTKRGFNRATDLRRSSGSTIKPLVAYGPAVDLGYGAGYVINDSPLQGSYSPNNSDGTFRGRISMRQAIMGSRNVCAVRMLAKIGVDVGWEYGVRLGLPLVDTDRNLSLTLGGLTYGVCPMEMAGGFAAFANHGLFIEPHCIEKIEDARGNLIYTADPETDQVFSPQAAYIMTDMLMSAVSGGTGTGAKLSGWQVAGKTGTNELPSRDDPDYRGLSGTKDAWFVGYTPVLVGAVWMGYDNKRDENGKLQYLRNIYGGSYPARLWKTVMSKALAGYEVKTFDKPEGITGVTIDTKSGMTPSSLTPGQYIGSEMYDVNHMPDGPSDIWTVVTVCQDSGRLATQYCPHTSRAVRIARDKNDPPSPKAADYGLYAPTGYCGIHTSEQSAMVTVNICTDPRHNGQAVLATSGCPSQYVESRSYSPDSVPTAYCTLSDHQGKPAAPDSGSGGETDSGENSSGGSVGKLNRPTNVNASVKGGTCMVSWSSDNHSAGTKFVVERVTDGDSSTQTRYVVYGNSCIDGSVESGHRYSYRLYAYNEEYVVASKWSKTVEVRL